MGSRAGASRWCEAQDKDRRMGDCKFGATVALSARVRAGPGEPGGAVRVDGCVAKPVPTVPFLDTEPPQNSRLASGARFAIVFS
jgi:hypothetical protein